MNRIFGAGIAGLLAFLSLEPAQAQTDACALAAGTNAANQFSTEIVYGRPNEQVAGIEVAKAMRNRGFEPFAMNTVTNGAIALVFYQNVTGKPEVKFWREVSVAGAVAGALEAAAGPMQSRSYAPYVRWVRCNYGGPASRAQLEQLTWGSSLSVPYGGYKPNIIEYTDSYGELYMIPGGGSPPPAPTPVPPGFGAGSLIGCWQRADGNVVSITADGTQSDGAPRFYGRHVVLSAEQARVGKTAGGFALGMHAILSRPGSYFGNYETRAGGNQVSGFTVVGNDLQSVVVDGSPRPAEILMWKRVSCPGGGAR